MTPGQPAVGAALRGRARAAGLPTDLRVGDTIDYTETAYWHPQGVWGLLYWNALVPAHLFIFKGMTRAIARRAETHSGETQPRRMVSGR